MELMYLKAGPADIDQLTKTRIEVLRSANGLDENADLSEVEYETIRYYEIAFRDDSHAAYLVFDGVKIVGAGGVSFYQVMPTCHNPSGRKAYIMNMYTHPAYRRRGIARETLGLLIGEARGRGIDFITLEATKMGRPLYESCGFVPLEDEMILPV